MKKRLIAFLLLAAMCFAGCGDQTGTQETEGTPAPMDMQAVYSSMTAVLPEMVLMNETMCLNLCGIEAADCTQMVVAKCSDGLRVDEIWLIEAVNEEALDRLENLTRSRLDSLGMQTQSYSPEQYAVVQKAKVIRSGNYLALLIAPNVQELADIFNNPAA